MLYFESVETGTLELLKNLMAARTLKEFRLAGGTSLALQIGHRQSVDLDLFGKFNFDEGDFSLLLSEFGKTELLKKTSNIRIYLIDGIKVDFVNYNYPWIDKLLVEDNLRFAGRKDIAAMKIAAITGRGTKKDFIDLYFLLKQFTLNEIIGFYLQKYTDANVIIALKSITYFADADSDIDPKMLSDISWDKIKEEIKITTKKYFNNIVNKYK